MKALKDMMNWRLSQVLLISFGLGSIALAMAACWYYLRESDALESSVSSALTAIAEVKAKQIANWRSERLGDGNVLASGQLSGLARRALSSGAQPADRAALSDVLLRYAGSFHYAGAALVDLNGQPRLELNTTHSDPVRFRALEAAAGHDVVLSDLYLESRSGQPWMSLTVPIPGAGAIILDIDPATFLFPYVKRWPTVSKTGETMLVRIENQEAIYLNELRHKSGTALRLHRSLAGMPMPDDRVLLQGWAYKGTDYRGVYTTAAMYKVPDSNWYLGAKIDVGEVEKPLRQLEWQMGALVLLIGIANASLVGLIWRGRQLRVHREREEWLEQIANETPAYLWMTNPGEENSFINWQFARFLGSREDRLRSGWPEYLHPEDREPAVAELRKCTASRADFHIEFRVRRFDGQYRWLVAHGVPRYTPGGDFAGYNGAMTDVTERRIAEEQRRDANAALARELRERTRSEQEVQALTARLIVAQEEERSRLALELHDDISQQIAAVSIATSKLKKRIPPDAVDAIALAARVQQKLIHLSEGIRRLSHQLHPSVLQHSGLAAALRNYCSELEGLTSVRIAFRSEGSFDGLAKPLALCVYRVAQEALQNAIKHAQVSEVEVSLISEPGEVRLVVSDRGVGIDPEAVSGKGGLGLVGIKERARSANGTVEIKGRPGEGTTVTLKIPFSS